MKTTSIVLSLAILACTPAWANEAALTLAKDSGCLSCHAMAEKIVGPAYQAVATKYAQDKEAVATLVASIQNGSKGKWGRIPMPAHREIPSADLEMLVRWILDQKS
jgi:cytochrome c